MKSVVPALVPHALRANTVTNVEKFDGTLAPTEFVLPISVGGKWSDPPNVEPACTTYDVAFSDRSQDTNARFWATSPARPITGEGALVQGPGPPLPIVKLNRSEGGLAVLPLNAVTATLKFPLVPGGIGIEMFLEAPVGTDATNVVPEKKSSR